MSFAQNKINKLRVLYRIKVNTLYVLCRIKVNIFTEAEKEWDIHYIYRGCVGFSE